jgi:hypothetical protein
MTRRILLQEGKAQDLLLLDIALSRSALALTARGDVRAGKAPRHE